MSLDSLKSNRASAYPNWDEFQSRLERHFKDFPIVPPKLPENVERLVALKRDGAVFIDNLLSPAEFEKLKRALQPKMKSLRAGDSTNLEPGTFDLYPELGRYRYYAIDKQVPEALILKDHPVINDLVDAYMSNNKEFWDLALEVRCVPPDWDAVLADCQPHCDHVFREVKVYLALDDITHRNGAMVYWTGTHRMGEWRKLPDYLSSIGGVWGESHILSGNAMASLMARCPELSDCRQIYCELKAGSILVCDTRGVHRTSYLHTGERWHIYSTYSMSGYRRRPVPNDNWLQPLDLSGT
jgi:hypothetical protein